MCFIYLFFVLLKLKLFKDIFSLMGLIIDRRGC